jgi:asparagine N-glycosylation enzyme membrane subunit Stt3
MERDLWDDPEQDGLVKCFKISRREKKTNYLLLRINQLVAYIMIIVMCFTQGRNMYVASLAVAVMTGSTT